MLRVTPTQVGDESGPLAAPDGISRGRAEPQCRGCRFVGDHAFCAAVAPVLCTVGSVDVRAQLRQAFTHVLNGDVGLQARDTDAGPVRG